MEEAKVHDVKLQYDGKTMILSSVEQPNRSIAFDPSTVQELVEFVRSLAREESDQADSSQQSDESDRREAANRREAFRVPVIDDSGLEISLNAGDQCQVKPTNISMTGVFVDLQNDSLINIKLGDEFQVKLALNKLSIDLDAVVRRQDGDGFGLFFPMSMKGGHVNPPPVLRQIVMELQRRWMTFKKASSQ